jgi:glycosyltransferase involved in cell wall biosynthesis
MIRWDTLMLGHFALDLDLWSPPATKKPSTSVRILHAPNHPALKGTHHFETAVAQLQAEGRAVELVLLQSVSNDEIREAMAGVDIVADQLVVGWYAMFAIEAMAMGKPVLCYLRKDLIELYCRAGLLEPEEPPIVNCSPATVTQALRQLVESETYRQEIGQRSRQFVERHHSLEAVGRVFDGINRSIGLRSDSLQDGCHDRRADHDALP